MDRKNSRRFDKTRDAQGPRGRIAPRRSGGRHNIVRLALLEG